SPGGAKYSTTATRRQRLTSTGGCRSGESLATLQDCAIRRRSQRCLLKNERNASRCGRKWLPCLAVANRSNEHQGNLCQTVSGRRRWNVAFLGVRHGVTAWQLQPRPREP